MNLTVGTTGRDFDLATETSHLSDRMTVDWEDQVLIGRHLVSHLDFESEIEPLRKTALQGAPIVDWQSTMELEKKWETTYSEVMGAEGVSWHRALAYATLGIVEESTPLSVRIADAAKPEEIIAVMRRFGLDSIAARIDYLHQLPSDDPEEPPFLVDSLRAMACFLVSEQQLGSPQIGVDPNGFAHAEWRLAEGGILAMEFLSSRLIRFAAVSAPARTGVERMRVSGELPKSETMDAVRPFTVRLESR